MTLHRGLVVRGEIQPGTDWIVRDDAAWWQDGERGTRRRRWPCDLLVGHWTAGAPHEGPGAAARVVRAMRARTRPDGSPLDVAIHIVVSWDGLVTQTCDLAVATVHVGSRAANARSIGVECCWPGTMAQAARLGVDGRARRRTVAGSPVDVLEPSAALLEAWARLAETIAGLDPATGVDVPRVAPLSARGDLLADRMSGASLRRWRGAIEHLHVTGTRKVDSAGLLCDALLRAGSGWRGQIA